MSIVLNEYEWAEGMIANQNLGRKPVETLDRVARYYYANHYSKPEIRSKLEVFLLQCDPDIALSRWDDTLDRLSSGAGRYPLSRMDGVEVTRPELERIDCLNGKQIQRLAFTLLCAAKYRDACSDKNNHWVGTPDREIFAMANVKTSVKRQSMMFGDLRQAGMICFAKRNDNLNVRVTFLQDGESGIFVSDFRNLGYQYLMYRGEAYFVCENCGMTVKARDPNRGRRQKYCDNCACEVRTRQNVEAIARGRKMAS